MRIQHQLRFKLLFLMILVPGNPFLQVVSMGKGFALTGADTGKTSIVLMHLALEHFGEILMLASCQFLKCVLVRLLFGFMGVIRTICSMFVFIKRNVAATFPRVNIQQSVLSMVQGACPAHTACAVGLCYHWVVCLLEDQNIIISFHWEIYHCLISFYSLGWS